MSINDGGPAFPVVGNPVHSKGACLRDYFAAKAMQTLTTERSMPVDIVASQAYELADAMLKARMRRKNDLLSVCE